MSLKGSRDFMRFFNLLCELFAKQFLARTQFAYVKKQKQVSKHNWNSNSNSKGEFLWNNK